MNLNYKLIKDVEVEGIDRRDAPDYVDAFIASTTYDGREMTEAELEELNADYDFVYENIINKIY